MCYLNIRREYKFYCLQFYLEEKFIAKSCSSWTKPFNLRGNWESISKLLSFSLCCCSSVMFKPVQLTFVRCSPFKLAFFFSFPFFFSSLLSNQLLAHSTLSLSSVVSPLFPATLFMESATAGWAPYEKFLWSYELSQLQMVILLCICHLLAFAAFLLTDKHLS